MGFLTGGENRVKAYLEATSAEIRDLIGTEWEVSHTWRESAGHHEMLTDMVTVSFIGVKDGRTYTIADFKLIGFPGCCGLVISTQTMVAESCRGRGIGKLLQHLKKHLALSLGFGAILAVTVQKNEIQHKVFEGAGYQHLEDVYNKGTGNTINMFLKKV